ncbi:MAG: hypothetical protein Q8R13_03205, partial [bacterium]|nr:hypothetical protein [bacterium]
MRWRWVVALIALLLPVPVSAREVWKHLDVQHWKHPGADPFVGDRVRAFVECGVSEDVARALDAAIRADTRVGEAFIEYDNTWARIEGRTVKTELDCMVSGKGNVKKVARSVVVDFVQRSHIEKSPLYRALDAAGNPVYAAKPPSCGNPTIVMIPPPVVKPPRPPREAPPERVAPPLPPVVEEEPPRKPYLWDADLFVGGGFVHGNDTTTWFGFAEGALYPYGWETSIGTNFIGFGGRAAAWDGRKSGEFDFGGYMAIPMLADKLDFKTGSVTFKAGAGWIYESGQTPDGRFEFERDTVVAGGCVGLSDYRRKLRGERWGNEIQCSLCGFAPLSTSASASFDGMALDNIIPSLSYILEPNLRQYIFDTALFRDAPWLRLYGEVGGSFQQRDAESVRALVGVSDINDIVGIGFGPSLDTNGSGIVSLLGVVWHSPTKLASYIQARRRQNTMIESLRN